MSTITIVSLVTVVTLQMMSIDPSKQSRTDNTLENLALDVYFATSGILLLILALCLTAALRPVIRATTKSQSCKESLLTESRRSTHTEAVERKGDEIQKFKCIFIIFTVAYGLRFVYQIGTIFKYSQVIK